MTKKRTKPDPRTSSDRLAVADIPKWAKEKFLARHAHELRYEFKRAGTKDKGGGRTLYPKVPKH